MKTTHKSRFVIILGFFTVILFSTCKTIPQYDFSLNNTLAIFLLEDKSDYYFCMPIQYMCDYQINNFLFVKGYITIGDYEILLKREDLKITVYLNEGLDLDEGLVDGFSLIYSEDKGNTQFTKMEEPLLVNSEAIDKYYHYYIFIEKHLSNEEMKSIVKEYEMGNVYSRFGIEYDITIDNELQAGSGLLDVFELYDGIAIDPIWFPSNLNYFRAKYLQK
jgi:hypothetical protein